jgi:two-component system chemotaxis response regulator CheB
MTGTVRVLVVDDSAVNRRSISDMLAEVPEVRIVGKAANGEEALRLVHVSEPDVITLDLEMPRMDGFTFLRILMAKKPLPVIVISSYSQKENVFKALELGALDFVAKPDLLVPGDLSIKSELVSKILMVRGLHKLKRPDPQFLRTRPPSMFPPAHAPEPSRVVVIGASTGGPGALMEVIGAMPEQTDMAILIAQHMPEKFTRTFAERLDRRSRLSVREAEHDDPVEPGTVLICPGLRCMELVRGNAGLRVRVFPPASTDRYYPSADRLFTSAAKVIGKDTIGVVLTGMADDGAKGALLVRQAGGYVIAESDETAVVYGMPRAAVDNGAAHRSLPLHEIAAALVAMEKGGPTPGNGRSGEVV